VPGDALPSGARVAPLLVGRYPVRQEEWDRVGGPAAGVRRPAAGPDLPAAGVSWLAARAWLARAGGGLRLPTEPEWEHACRAGAVTPWFFGARFDPAWCWYLDNAGRRPQEVSRHDERPNAFGLVDAAGNVTEWCDADLDVPMEGSSWQEWDPGKVHRGGSFERPSRYCRADVRAGADPRRTYPELGLRAFRAVG